MSSTRVHSRERLLVPALFVGTSVVAVTASLGAPLVPLISRDMHVELSEAQWAVTVTLLVGAVSSPLMGRIGDGPHRRAAFIGGLVVLLAGTVLSAVAGSLLVLVVGRALQGVGLGLAPLAMAAVRDALPSERVRPAIALLSIATVAGAGIGFPVSGVMASLGGLSAAYWFGAAAVAVVFVLVAPVFPASSPQSDATVDLPGAGLVGAALIALLLGIGQGKAWGWTSPAILTLLGSAVVLFAIWAFHQLYVAPAPLVELRLLTHRTVLVANLAAIVLGAAMYINLSIITAFAQAPPAGGFGFGATTLIAGLCFIPWSVGTVASSRLIHGITRVFGLRSVLPMGCVLVACGSGLFIVAHSALWQLFVEMGVVGTGLGLTFAAIPGLIVSAVPYNETGSALGFYQVIRYIGFSLGSALAAAILAGHTPPGARLPAETGYTTAIWVAVGLCTAAATLAWTVGTDPASAEHPRRRPTTTLATASGSAADQTTPSQH